MPYAQPAQPAQPHHREPRAASPLTLNNETYRQLRRLAARQLSRERKDHTLQPTALVHEVVLRLLRHHDTGANRAQFFAFASRLMRHVLVDHARERKAAKRGGGVRPLNVDLDQLGSEITDSELLMLDEALTHLEKLDPRQAQVVMLRYFGGLSVEEVGQVLEISARTVKREWRTAKAWLRVQLQP